MFSTISNHTILIVCILLLSGTELAGQTPEPMQVSLDKARQHALEHNLELQNARADARIAQRRVWEITAQGLPQVSGSVGYQYFTDIPTNLIPAEFFGGQPGEFAEVQFGTEQNLSASLNINQLIFDGSYIVGLQAARIFRELSERIFTRSEIETRSMVTETYYMCQATDQNLEIMRQNLTNLEKTLFETRKMFEAGFTDAINVDQLRLTVANLKNTIANMERQRELSFNLLKFQMGLPLDTPIELTDKLESLFASLSLETLAVEEFDPSRHIDFRILQSQEQMQLMAMRREWSFYLPTVSAFYTRQENAYRNEFNFFQSSQPWYPTSLVGVNINIPIFSSGMRSSRVQQVRLELEKARNNTLQVEQSLRLQQQEALSGIKTALEKYSNEQENLQLAERIFNRTRIMFREGLASSLELTQASDQFISTQANYINAMFELLNASNKLDKAMGRL